MEVSLEIKEKAKELPFQLDDDESESAKNQLISKDLEEILDKLTAGSTSRFVLLTLRFRCEDGGLREHVPYQDRRYAESA